MGRITPERIEVTTFGDTKRRYIDALPEEPLGIKCDYCGLYGKLGRCEGCGAPNRPLAKSWLTPNPNVQAPPCVKRTRW